MKNRYRIGVFALMATAACQGLSAQSTPAAAPEEPEEEVIELSPFEVTATQDRGYQATQTLAGTRIRTNLADVGGSIQVLTKAFLDDIGATDNQSLLQYTTNTQVAGPRGTYGGMGNSTSVSEQGNLTNPQNAQRVRGLASADSARDYFITDIPWDSFNIDRIDILRGPNSILYGLGSPAGIINASTRSAEFRNRGNFQARTGSYGSMRSSLDINQQIIPGVLAMRVDGLWAERKYQQDPAFENQRRIYGAVRFDPQFFSRRDFHTSIRAKVEAGEIEANRPRTVPPMDSVTPWFRPREISESNPFGGMGRHVVENVYDPTRTDGAAVGNGYGAANNTTVNYQPYLTGAQVQQPFYFIDGATNRLDSAFAGYINNGWRNTTGAVQGIAAGNAGLRQFVPFYSVQSFTQAALNYNNWRPTEYFTDSRYGQYRAMSLLDPSVFDFYHQLIDGPNKRETQTWNAHNFDIQQTLFDDRLGINLSYDQQHVVTGSWSLLGWQPSISIDLTKNGQDYYLNPSSTGITNPNYGRPFVYGAGGSGGGVTTSDRKAIRASLFGEIRPSDLTSNQFLLKLLGKQRFNGVSAEDRYVTDRYSYQLYGNSKAFQGFWNQNDGTSVSAFDRPPQAVIYLGPSIVNATTPAGLNIPNIRANITLPDTGVRLFDATWQNYGVAFSDPWNVPTSLSRVYNGVPVAGTTQLSQSSNPANYVGWRAFENSLERYDDGENKTLVTSPSRAMRETISHSGSYQGYFWNDALVATYGWRYDQVKSKSVIAPRVAANRNTYNLDPNVYRLPDGYKPSEIVKGHSTSGGAVLHLNRLFARDILPLKVSLSYNESSNFQVTSLRSDVYGTPIDNPKGETVEYGALISTKDDKYSLRVINYKTGLTNGTSTLSNQHILGQVVSNGLTWRNIYLFQLGGYDWGTRNQPQGRNVWTNAFAVGGTNVLSPTTPYTQEQADKDLDTAIDTWNTIQKELTAKGFFQAWNFNPLSEKSLVNRSTYAANPAAYEPDPSTVSNYAAASNTFAVTSDTQSKGYEFEFIANPTPNWRLSFNAANVSATENNVGGQALADYITYINSKLVNANGSPTPAGAVPRFGGYGNAIYPSIWAPFLSNYTLLKLKEGSDVAELRKWSYRGVANYTFTNGFMKGVGVGGSYRWEDKVGIGYPVLAGGQIAGYDLSNPYYGPANDAFDLWLSYRRKLTSKIDWSIQLNVFNVGQKNELIPISIQPDGKTWASVRMSPVEEWQLTTTFSF